MQRYGASQGNLDALAQTLLTLGETTESGGHDGEKPRLLILLGWLASLGRVVSARCGLPACQPGVRVSNYEEALGQYEDILVRIGISSLNSMPATLPSN